MKCSVVNYATVIEALDQRIDPEFWSPDVLYAKHIIQGSPLGSYVEDGYRVVYENTKIIDKQIQQKDNLLPFFIQASDIEDCYINMDTVNCVSEEDWIRYPKGRIKKGEILVEVKGNVRKVAIVTKDIPEKCLVSGTLYKLTLKKINCFYVLCFLSCKYGQILKNRLICNIATPFINKEGLYSIPIPNCSHNFQNLIESVYSTSLDLKDMTQNIYKQCEYKLLQFMDLLNWKPKYKTSYVRNFSDTKISNRLDAEYFQPKYDELINNIKSYPNGCDVLDDIVVIKKGVEIGSEAYVGEGYPFVRVSNLSKFGLTNNNQQYLSKELYEELKAKYQPKRNDIILSKDGTPGIAYLLSEEPEKMILSGGLLRLELKNAKDYLPEYLTLVLNSILVQQQIEQKISGALIQHWLVDDIKSTIIPKLEKEKQQELVDQIKEATLARKQFKQLLEIAKHGVEKAIEENEDVALQWIGEQLKQIGVTL